MTVRAMRAPDESFSLIRKIIGTDMRVLTLRPPRMPARKRQRDTPAAAASLKPSCVDSTAIALCTRPSVSTMNSTTTRAIDTSRFSCGGKSGAGCAIGCGTWSRSARLKIFPNPSPRLPVRRMLCGITNTLACDKSGGGTSVP